MQDTLGNSTEEAVKDFIQKLDQDIQVGPKPLNGVSFDLKSISEVLECSDEVARELFTKPSPFKFDENDQVYLEIESDDPDVKEKLYIISDKNDSSYSLACEEICGQLPEVTFDLECGGYPHRQSEAASLYKVCVINALQENQYGKEINEALIGYDFTRWTGKNSKYVFTQILQKVQEEADSVSRVVLMCANTKLIADRVKKDISYKGILKEEDAEKLRLLSETDARINFAYNKKYETAANAKEKIQIGEELAEERRKMISQKFVTPEIAILFHIYGLNQNAIPGRAKRKIRNAASLYVDELVSQDLISNIESASEFKKKLVVRAQKLFLSRMKQIRYKLWRDRTPDLDLSTLIPKY